MLATVIPSTVRRVLWNKSACVCVCLQCQRSKKQLYKILGLFMVTAVFDSGTWTDESFSWSNFVGYAPLDSACRSIKCFHGLSLFTFVPLTSDFGSIRFLRRKNPASCGFFDARLWTNIRFYQSGYWVSQKFYNGLDKWQCLIRVFRAIEE